MFQWDRAFDAHFVQCLDDCSGEQGVLLGPKRHLLEASSRIATSCCLTASDRACHNDGHLEDRPVWLVFSDQIYLLRAFSRSRLIAGHVAPHCLASASMDVSSIANSLPETRETSQRSSKDEIP